MIKLFVNNTEVQIKFMKFPAGETNIQIDKAIKHKTLMAPVRVRIYCKFESNEDLVNLLLVTSAVKNDLGYREVHLDMPYFPYARQDRVCNPGEALSVKVIADLINSQDYITVAIADPHSEVTPALINRCVVTEQHECVRRTVWSNNYVLVAPDAGAAKKVYKVAYHNQIKEVIPATKHRDTKTGEITQTTVHTDKTYTEDFLVVDDICDGGRTFIELAKVLRPITTGKLVLYVTHGLFTKGVDVLLEHYDEIFCYNDYSGDSRVKSH